MKLLLYYWRQVMEQEKKAYTPPEIIFETTLETKAGSPLGEPNPGGDSEIDLFPGSGG
jgi:hypothetical protein